MKRLPFNHNRQSQGALPIVAEIKKVYYRYAFQVITESGTVVHDGEIDCDIIEVAEVEKLAREDFGNHIRNKYGHGSDIVVSRLARPHRVIFIRKQVQ